MIENLLSSLPTEKLPAERTDVVLERDSVRIERIVSTGQASPPGFWYDQDEWEWVVVLQGEAELEFAEEDRRVRLRPGDHLLIPAHCRHRVAWTSGDGPTVWLAVWWRGP